MEKKDAPRKFIIHIIVFILSPYSPDNMEHGEDPWIMQSYRMSLGLSFFKFSPQLLSLLLTRGQGSICGDGNHLFHLFLALSWHFLHDLVDIFSCRGSLKRHYTVQISAELPFLFIVFPRRGAFWISISGCARDSGVNIFCCFCSW